MQLALSMITRLMPSMPANLGCSQGVHCPLCMYVDPHSVNRNVQQPAMHITKQTPSQLTMVTCKTV